MMLELPIFYQEGTLSLSFNLRIFLKWIREAIWMSILCYTMAFCIFRSASLRAIPNTFSHGLGGRASPGDAHYKGHPTKGMPGGPEVGIEEFRKDMIGISRECDRILHGFLIFTV
jgi:hypothetical protein